MIIGLENQFYAFLRVTVLHRFYCLWYVQKSSVLAQISVLQVIIVIFVMFELLM